MIKAKLRISHSSGVHTEKWVAVIELSETSWCLCFECEISPTGSCVSTFGPQMVAMFGKVMEPSEDEGFPEGSASLGLGFEIL